MVCSGEGERPGNGPGGGGRAIRVSVMENGTSSGGGRGGSEERVSKPPLHNFNLPSLKWGHQRQLRCIKLPEDGGGDRSRRNGSPPTMGKRGSAIGGDEGIDVVREKIMLDLKTAAARMKDAIFRKKSAVFEESEEEKEEGEEVRRWNLRTRRGSAVLGKDGASPAPAVVAGVAAGGGGRRVGGGVENCSPKKKGESGEEEKKREKFSVALKRKEIEEDFMAMVGHRPARRPKKRPRNVQRQLDTLFPGLWLTEVTVDTYKVPDCPDNGKR